SGAVEQLRSERADVLRGRKAPLDSGATLGADFNDVLLLAYVTRADNLQRSVIHQSVGWRRPIGDAELIEFKYARFGQWHAPNQTSYARISTLLRYSMSDADGQLAVAVSVAVTIAVTIRYCGDRRALGQRVGDAEQRLRQPIDRVVLSVALHQAL